MQKTKPLYSLIIPAYNEADCIASTLHESAAYFEEKKWPHEIIVVSDGCTDNTSGIVKKIALSNKNVFIINRSNNIGKSRSICEGMLAAQGAVRFFMDADHATHISHFDLMHNLFENGTDVAICSRSPLDTAGARQVIKQHLFRRLAGISGNLLIQTLLVPGIWDTQCGFKAFSAEAALHIFSRSRVRGWAGDVEWLSLARALNYKIEIVPALWYAKEGSKIKLRSYLFFLRDVLKIRFAMSRDDYEII